MFKVNEVTIKEAKNGNPYKALKGEYNGEEIKINMFSDHPEYDNTVEGYEFACNISVNGDYYNFDVEGKPRYNKAPKPQPVADQMTSAKLEAIWTGIKEIGRHLNVPYFEAGTGNGHTDEQLEMLKDVKPEDIPF